MTLKIRASYARLASGMASTSDLRVQLEYISVEPRADGGAFIVGTNGHALIAIIDSQAVCEKQTLIKIGKDTLPHLPKVGSRDDQDNAVVELRDFDGKPALLTRNYAGMPVHLQISDAVHTDGLTFPNWRKVTPDLSTLSAGAKGAFNHGLLASAMKNISSGRYAHPVTMFQSTETSAIATRIEPFNNVLLIIMPMRGDAAVETWKKAWAKS